MNDLLFSKLNDFLRTMRWLGFLFLSTTLAEMNTTKSNVDPEWAKKRFWLGSIHGILMVVAWIFLIPKATIAARYLRNHSSRNSVFKLPNWFQLHRNSNYAAVILSLVSIGFILYAQGFRWTGPWFGRNFFSPGVLHSFLGAISISLATLQPIMAYFRPKPATQKRFLFNLLHRCCGITSLAFAMGAMFLVAQKFGKRFHRPDLVWFFWLIFLFIIAICVVILEILFRMTTSPMRIGSDMELSENKKQIYDSTDAEEKRKKLLKEKEDWLMWTSSLIFVLFTIITFGITVIIIINMLLKF
ncbi:unnamed protein product, partial [Mesorhabditis belari]|uniref:Cytochrome b561 domain-containing protein n=1 Tax=Mesorhabditis belari TaxID=2138241 RepID=A0AAF3F5T9_9BILA